MRTRRTPFLVLLFAAAILTHASSAFGAEKCTNKNQVGAVQYDSRTNVFKVCKGAGGWEILDMRRFVGPAGPVGPSGPAGAPGAVGPRGPAGDSFWTQPQSGVASITYSGEIVASSVTASEANVDHVRASTVRIGDSDTTCDADHAGLLRFRTDTRTFEGCNGTAWVTVSAAGGGTDGGTDGADGKDAGGTDGKDGTGTDGKDGTGTDGKDGGGS